MLFSCDNTYIKDNEQKAMDNTDIVERARKEIAASPFLKDNYEATLFFRRSIRGLLYYTEYSESEDLSDIFKAVPEFQRSNDKWSLEMQIGFVKNVIKGFNTVIMLYEIKENPDKHSEYTNCKIMDGLQRITAIHDFMKGKFKVMGMSYQDMVDSNLMSYTSMPIRFKIYSFRNEKEAIEFYIEMNENITHSPQDIDKAKAALAALT